MVSSNRVKVGGWAGVLVAALLVLTTILTQIAPVDSVYDSPTDYLTQVVVLATFVGTLMAVVGLDARQRRHERYGRLGTIGTVFTLIGYGIVALVVLAGIVMGGRVLTEIRLVGAVGVVVGGILLGIATLRARDLPWWCGVLLILAFPSGHFANQVMAGTEGLIMALLWGSVGVALLQRAGSPAESVVDQPVRAN